MLLRLGHKSGHLKACVHYLTFLIHYFTKMTIPVTHFFSSLTLYIIRESSTYGIVSIPNMSKT